MSSEKAIKRMFKKAYREEFEDANESFMDFLLDLIPIEKLEDIISKGNDYYYSNFKKYR